jgi:outer membrane protein assembly factor BamD (BamD/ComL family)
MVRHVLVAILWLCPAPAAAQDASKTKTVADKAAADTLFYQGKHLIAAGDVDRACQAFETSLRLFDQLGVRLNLADCHERQGRPVPRPDSPG